MRTIYLLRSGELMPFRIPLPPTSIKPYTDFVNTAFLFRKRRIFSGVVRIGLTRETNTRLNKDYSVVNFTKLYDFEGEELAQIRSFAGGFITQIKQMNQQRAAMLAAGAAIPEDAAGAPAVLPENGGHFVDACVLDGEREKLPA